MFKAVLKPREKDKIINDNLIPFLKSKAFQIKKDIEKDGVSIVSFESKDDEILDLFMEPGKTEGVRVRNSNALITKSFKIGKNLSVRVSLNDSSTRELEVKKVEVRSPKTSLISPFFRFFSPK